MATGHRSWSTRDRSRDLRLHRERTHARRCVCAVGGGRRNGPPPGVPWARVGGLCESRRSPEPHRGHRTRRLTATVIESSFSTSQPAWGTDCLVDTAAGALNSRGVVVGGGPTSAPLLSITARRRTADRNQNGRRCHRSMEAASRPDRKVDIYGGCHEQACGCPRMAVAAAACLEEAGWPPAAAIGIAHLLRATRGLRRPQGH